MASGKQTIHQLPYQESSSSTTSNDASFSSMTMRCLAERSSCDGDPCRDSLYGEILCGDDEYPSGPCCFIARSGVAGTGDDGFACSAEGAAPPPLLVLLFLCRRSRRFFSFRRLIPSACSAGANMNRTASASSTRCPPPCFK
jgi:hypothetical protein